MYFATSGSSSVRTSTCAILRRGIAIHIEQVRTASTSSPGDDDSSKRRKRISTQDTPRSYRRLSTTSWTQITARRGQCQDAEMSMSKPHMLHDRTVGVLLERAMGLVHH